MEFIVSALRNSTNDRVYDALPAPATRLATRSLNQRRDRVSRMILTIAAALALAVLVHHLALRLGVVSGPRLLAAWIATSAWLYVGIAVLASAWRQTLLAGGAALGSFALAHLALGFSVEWIAAGLLLHGLFGLVWMLSTNGKRSQLPALAWSIFHLGLALLVTV